MTPRILAPLAVLAVSACVADPEVSGAMLFAQNCAACHGGDAMGGGPMATGLTPQPPDLTGLSARNDGVFPRDYVMSTIDGYARGSQIGPMPEFGAGDLGDMVMVEGPDGLGTPVPARLLALADYLESIQR